MAFVLRRILQPSLQRYLTTSCTKYVHSSAICYGSSVARSNIAAPSKPTAEVEQKVLVSEACLKRLREICQDGSFLRIMVEGGGCSGFQYKFDLDNKLNDDDREFGEGQAKVVIDNVSLEYCAGATVDYHTELIRAGFRIQANPQAEQGCSCGTSFAIKLD